MITNNTADRRTSDWNYNHGQQLYAIRKRLCLSQEALAERIGVEGKTVGRWERAEIDIRNANYGVVRRLIRVLGKECEALLDSLEEGPFFRTSVSWQFRLKRGIIWLSSEIHRQELPEAQFPAVFLPARAP